MKATFPAAVLCALAVTLASCGGGSSSSGLFGGIISAQQNYEEKSDKLTGSMNEHNYQSRQEEADKLKEETARKIEADATGLSGREAPCEAEASQLAIKEPITLLFDGMNHLRPMFKLEGKVVASADLSLNADPSDLKGEKLLSGGKVTVTVTMPVALDILDKDGNVLRHMNEIGVLPAENLGTSAVVKAGTPVDLNGCIVVDKELEGATTFRLSIDLSKAPYTSRGLK